MQEQLSNILQEAKNGQASISSQVQFDAYKASIIGPNGSLTKIMKSMKDLSKDERPAAGKLINQTKTALEEIFAQIATNLEEALLASMLGEKIDPTLDSPNPPIGTVHPLSATIQSVCQIFKKLGFSVATGPEAETEWYCFDALNTPACHPARDAQDTLFFPDDSSFGNVSKKFNEQRLLRSHTSTVQIRTMLSEKPPLRILAPGRVFRRDTCDATHSANFHQIEGLLVDKDVTIVDLKSTLDIFLKELFGKNLKMRLRPSFFPFTEPSFEIDFMSQNMGKLSNKWIEIAGCGMVDPNVFANVGIDSEVYSGFAFGFGVERIAMLLHGIDDIRYFYQNNLNFLKQF